MGEKRGGGHIVLRMGATCVWGWLLYNPYLQIHEQNEDYQSIFEVNNIFVYAYQKIESLEFVASFIFPRSILYPWHGIIACDIMGV